MKSSIRVDVDNDDIPVLTIECVTTSTDLRDKALQSFLRKLGFQFAERDQKAKLIIEYKGWGGSSPNGDCHENYEIRPVKDSAYVLEA